MFKQTLRQHLANHFPSQELSRWFDPLSMELDEKEKLLRVTFPHSFFGRWFMRTVRQDFENHAADLARDMSILYEGGPFFSPASLPPAAGSAPENPLWEFFPPDSPPAQHTFATFLVNRKNDFPLAAAKAFVENKPGEKNDRLSYIPFVLYGQSGAGKSHLLGAMANALKDSGQPFFYGDISFLERIRVTPGRYGPVNEHLVFLDDVQRVSANLDFQEALIALVDMFCVSGRLLALALDAHPTAYPGFGQKLRSRLCSGLVVELKRPDLDIRRQYIQGRNNELNLNLTRDQMLSLAQRHHDLRSIDGALTRLLAYRSLLNEDAGAQNADVASLLHQGLNTEALTPALIAAVVAKHFSVSPDDIFGKSRDKTITLARHIAILLCRELIGLSLVQTGRVFGGRDHSSVLYSLKKMKQMLFSDKDMNKMVEELRKLCVNQR